MSRAYNTIDATLTNPRAFMILKDRRFEAAQTAQVPVYFRYELERM